MRHEHDRLLMNIAKNGYSVPRLSILFRRTVQLRHGHVFSAISCLKILLVHFFLPSIYIELNEYISGTSSQGVGLTPPHQVSRVAHLLVEHDAVVASWDKDGNTPLNEAPFSGNAKVTLLIELGAVTTVRNA
jgi:hypothetical protein